MKTTKLLLAIALITVSITAFASETGPSKKISAPEFTWGDTQDTVQIVEGQPLAIETPEFIWGEEIDATLAADLLDTGDSRASGYLEFSWNAPVSVISFPEFVWGDADEAQPPVTFPDFSWGTPEEIISDQN